MLGCILPSFPKAYVLEDSPGVASYPLEEWEAQNAPFMSVKSWACLHEGGNEGVRQPAQDVWGE